MGEDRKLVFSVYMDGEELCLMNETKELEELEIVKDEMEEIPSLIFDGGSFNIDSFSPQFKSMFIDTERGSFETRPDSFDAIVRSHDSEIYLKGIRPTKIETLWWDFEHYEKAIAYARYLRRVENRKKLHAKKPKRKRKVRM